MSYGFNMQISHSTGSNGLATLFLSEKVNRRIPVCRNRCYLKMYRCTDKSKENGKKEIELQFLFGTRRTQISVYFKILWHRWSRWSQFFGFLHLNSTDTKP